MGTVTVTSSAKAVTEAALCVWYQGELEYMACKGRTGSCCGNWNSNEGLTIVAQSFKTQEAAEQYAKKKWPTNADPFWPCALVTSRRCFQ